MPAESPPISVVVIGRNEGERLVRCLRSVWAADYAADGLELIYVDSSSSDGSAERAESLGARVIRIQPQHPTAAAARNAGLNAAAFDLVQFLDGDTILTTSWLRKAAAVMDDPSVTAVYGRCEELAPQASIYNFWTHHDWYVPPGRVESSGGNVLIRRGALLAVGGYDAGLIAGEERDVCYRLIRDHGATILCLSESMILHDIDMTRFDQYWRRCFRSGYAYAEVAARYAGLKAWRRTCRRNLLFGGALLTTVALSAGFWSLWPVVIGVGLVALGMGRDGLRHRRRVGGLARAVLYGCHHYLSKGPLILGHLAYYRRAWWGGRPQPLIEYRTNLRNPAG